LLRPAAAKRKRCSASRLGADKATTATSVGEVVRPAIYPNDSS
jgi:hypothetical protein